MNQMTLQRKRNKKSNRRTAIKDGVRRKDMTYQNGLPKPEAKVKASKTKAPKPVKGNTVRPEGATNKAVNFLRKTMGGA